MVHIPRNKRGEKKYYAMVAFYTKEGAEAAKAFSNVLRLKNQAIYVEDWRYDVAANFESLELQSPRRSLVEDNALRPLGYR